VCSQKRDAIAKQLLARASAAAAKPGKGKTVYRNLRDGDLMLTNRQPTLHKPGMMAHRARVLKAMPSNLHALSMQLLV
jgi:DNA-directed RNA polymerase I subunit RPA1